MREYTITRLQTYTWDRHPNRPDSFHTDTRRRIYVEAQHKRPRLGEDGSANADPKQDMRTKQSTILQHSAWYVTEREDIYAKTYATSQLLSFMEVADSAI